MSKLLLIKVSTFLSPTLLYCLSNSSPPSIPPPFAQTVSPKDVFEKYDAILKAVKCIMGDLKIRDEKVKSEEEKVRQKVKDLAGEPACESLSTSGAVSNAINTASFATILAFCEELGIVLYKERRKARENLRLVQGQYQKQVKMVREKVDQASSIFNKARGRHNADVTAANFIAAKRDYDNY